MIIKERLKNIDLKETINIFYRNKNQQKHFNYPLALYPLVSIVNGIRTKKNDVAVCLKAFIDSVIGCFLQIDNSSIKKL